jgi:hypothetical protein
MDMLFGLSVSYNTIHPETTGKQTEKATPLSVTSPAGFLIAAAL